MARRWEFCNCIGRNCGEPSFTELSAAGHYFYRPHFQIQNVTDPESGSVEVCGTGHWSRKQLFLIGTIFADYDSTVAVIALSMIHLGDLEFDENLGKWTAEVPAPGQPDYAHRWMFEFWDARDPSAFLSSSDDCLVTYAADTEGGPLTPKILVNYGWQNSIDRNIRTFSAAYQKSDCELVGNLSPYYGVLPEIMFSRPREYTLPLDGIVTAAGAMSGDVTLEFCVTQTVSCPAYSPDIYVCQNRLDPTCSQANIRNGFAYFRLPSCCDGLPDVGELVIAILDAEIDTLSLTFHVGYDAFDQIYQNGTVLYALSSGDVFSEAVFTRTAIASIIPGDWTFPDEITVTHTGY